MSLPTILGFVVGIAFFFLSIIISTDNYAIFFHATGVMMVIGGTLAATFVAFEPRYVLQSLRSAGSIFFQHNRAFPPPPTSWRPWKIPARSGTSWI